MGQICGESLQNVQKTTNGVEVSYDKNIEKCIICIKGKHAKAYCAENVLDLLIHTDVMGPLRTKSFSGTRYLLIFVDNANRKVFVVSINLHFLLM